MNTEKPKTLAAKLCNIMGECKGVAAAGRNEHQGYSYIKAADIADALRALLVKHKVIILPSVQEHKTIQYINPKGATVNYASCRVIYSIVNAEDPNDIYNVTQAADGADTGGDKGLFKALTGCHKYMLRQTFCLGTDDDAEKDEGMHPEPPAKSSSPAPKVPRKLSEVETIINSGKWGELGAWTIQSKCSQKGKPLDALFKDDSNWVLTVLADSKKLNALMTDDKNALIYYSKFLEAKGK